MHIRINHLFSQHIPVLCDNSVCYSYDHNVIAVHAVIVTFTEEREEHYNVKGTAVWLHNCEVRN